MSGEVPCTRSPGGALMEISNGGYLQHAWQREAAHLKRWSRWRRGCGTALPRDSSRCWSSQWGGPPPGTGVHSGKWQKHPLSTAEKLMRMERENVYKRSVMLPMETRTTDRNSDHVKWKPRVLQKRKKIPVYSPYFDSKTHHSQRWILLEFLIVLWKWFVCDLYLLQSPEEHILF